jgi:hypothetical protein
MSHARIPIMTLSIPITTDSIAYRRWKINGKMVEIWWKRGGKEVKAGQGHTPTRTEPP